MQVRDSFTQLKDKLFVEIDAGQTIEAIHEQVRAVAVQSNAEERYSTLISNAKWRALDTL